MRASWLQRVRRLQAVFHAELPLLQSVRRHTIIRDSSTPKNEFVSSGL